LSHHLEPGFIYSTPQPSDTITNQLNHGTVSLHPLPVVAVLTILVQGKQHGSLARAGKVKSQTPKVEKQEKKKTPKGRAKKRLLYNRRFVTVANLRPGAKRRVRSHC
jgi:small subunit ribosomal protein S30e